MLIPNTIALTCFNFLQGVFYYITVNIMLVTSHYAVIAINALTYCKLHMLESLLQIILESLL